ncbi:MAG TPA: O-antigen ligase family protein [Longimicrobium sp.]|nr:O-antigen ligase family protein [Longimicrobium sp.]
MVVRLIVLTYFALLFVAEAVSDLADSHALAVLFLLPAAGYATWRVTLAATHFALRKDGQRPMATGQLAAAVLVYVALYSLLYLPRGETALAAMRGFVTLFVHTAFWHAAFCAPAYRGERRKRFFADLLCSLFLGTVVGAGFALAYTGWSFEPGSVHDLSGRAPGVRSDLDVPFLALLLGVWGIVILFVRRRFRGTVAGVGRVLRSPLLGIALVGCCVAVLVLYGRRTPLIALVTAGAFLVVPGAVGRKLAYLAVLFPFVPLAWDMVAAVLLRVTQNSLAAAILVRNDPDDYLTGTNRLYVWMASLDYLSEPRFGHLVGFGGAPGFLLQNTADWTHTHNAYLQLVFDAGVPVLVLALAILVTALRRVSLAISLDRQPYCAYVLLGLLVAWLVTSGVEPTLRSLALPHLVFILLTLVAANLLWGLPRRRAPAR